MTTVLSEPDTVLTDDAHTTFDQLAIACYEADRYKNIPNDPETIGGFRHQLTDDDYRFAGRGNGRMVFTVPDRLKTVERRIVVKFPIAPEPGERGTHHSDGHYQNRIERIARDHVPVDIEHLFADVYDVDEDDFWLTMPYVKTLDPFDDTFDWEAKLRERLAGTPFSDLDFDRSNVGWLETGRQLDPADPLTKGTKQLVVRDIGYFVDEMPWFVD